MKHINHPAFPVAGYPGDAKNPPVRPNSGIGVMDYFAALVAPSIWDGDMLPNDVAREAYLIADAMMTEREKRLSSR
jgi:hypothetical protein